MLHLETVAPRAFSVLEQLMYMPELKAFSFVKGTALSLLFGHRKSDDLDLFSNLPFINDKIIQSSSKKFKARFDNRSSTLRFGIFCYIDQVQVDIIRQLVVGGW